jgi:methionyl-tRNA formyltransferase
VAAIVTQPPARRDRGKKLMPSPVAEFALDTGFPSDLIFTPERAGEVILVVFVWEFEFFFFFLSS